MASPQAEKGAIKIAYDLYGALLQKGLTGLQLHVFLTILALSYGRGQTKAKMSIEDIRSVIGSYSKYRRYRFIDTLTELHGMAMISSQALGDDVYILGPQKDYDRWQPLESIAKTVQEPNNENSDDLREDAKNVQLLRNRDINNSNNTIRSMPQIICTYAYQHHPYKPTGKLLKKEVATARELYGQALIKHRVPRDATYLLKDFLDDLIADDFVRGKVKLIFAFAKTRFRQFAESIPEKPYTVTKDEQAIGRRYKYDLKTKRWRPTDDKV